MDTSLNHTETRPLRLAQPIYQTQKGHLTTTASQELEANPQPLNKHPYPNAYAPRKTQTTRDLEAEKQKIMQEEKRFGHSTKGVRKRLERVQNADNSAEDKTSQIAKFMQSNREQQQHKKEGRLSDSSSSIKR